MRVVPRAASAWPYKARVQADGAGPQGTATPDVAFPPAARVADPAGYAAALRGRRVARGDLLALHVATPAMPAARLGLIVGKRLAPLSVSRNAIKRVLREAFRVQRHTLPARDYVVRLQAKIPEISLTELKRRVRQEADAHFARAGRVLT